MLKNLFAKIKELFLGLSQKREARRKDREIHNARKKERVDISPLSDAQIYGTLGEREAVNDIISLLPEARIKTNVIILNKNGNAEIDCMLLYRGSLFAIEIKSWKGDVYETEDGFVKHKRDPYTGEIHTKYFKSPLRQIRRAISLLKENMTGHVYINGVVYIEENDSLRVSEGSPVFDRIEDLVDYIERESKPTSQASTKFFNELRPADRIIGSGIFGTRKQLLAVAILDFATQGAWYMDVIHNYTSDTAVLHYQDGTTKAYSFENKKIKALTTDGAVELTLSGIDRIIFGKEKNAY